MSIKNNFQQITQVLIVTGMSSDMVVCSSSLASQALTLKPTCVSRPPELHLAFILGRFSMLNSVDIVRSHSLSPESVRNSEFGKRENGLFPIKSKIEAPSDLPT